MKSYRIGKKSLFTYLCPSLPVEHRPSTTPRHRFLFWAALVIPDQLVPCCFSSASVIGNKRECLKLCNDLNDLDVSATTKRWLPRRSEPVTAPRTLEPRVPEEATLTRYSVEMFMFVGCLTSQQYASVSQGRIWSDNFTFCHTEIEVADPTFYPTQS